MTRFGGMLSSLVLFEPGLSSSRTHGSYLQIGRRSSFGGQHSSTWRLSFSSRSSSSVAAGSLTRASSRSVATSFASAPWTSVCQCSSLLAWQVCREIFSSWQVVISK